MTTSPTTTTTSPVLPWPPPDDLGEAGRKIWIDQAARMGSALNPELERVALFDCCRAADRLQAARAQIEEEGVLTQDQRGNPIRHPMLEVQRAAGAELQRYLKRYRAAPVREAAPAQGTAPNGEPESAPRTVSQWAGALNCSKTSAQNYIKRGIVKPGMSAEEGRAALGAHKRKQQGLPDVPGDGPSPAEAERAESTRLKATRRAVLELELQQKSKALVPAAAVAERWLRMTSRWVAALRAMPARYDGALAAFSGKDASECRRWLQKAVDETIAEARLDDAE